MIILLGTIAITVVLFVWVLRGLRGPNERLEDIPFGTSPPQERKYGAYRSILDLEEDFAVGKVTVEDREILSVEYEAEAIAALREIRIAESDSEEDVRAQLELEISAARSALKTTMKGGAA